ncbi:hypothetical protein CAEBREN_20078 [Caenorhabditis brenneri]|uniref:F-box domain-containing protein n=1 Tax=Caenorhabditis brenneri TaxID=135651 RepID=G0NGR4_CAEBE|nr:hypothetical protein CAEBREN_20078 [Caenorhabditis brenneri]
MSSRMSLKFELLSVCNFGCPDFQLPRFSLFFICINPKTMSFPLHKLPASAILQVLQLMDIYDQLTYSLCSKNTKKMVKSLGLRATTIQVHVQKKIGICINFDNSNYNFFWSSFEHGYYFPDEEFRIPWYIEAVAWNNVKKETEWKWYGANIGIREYLHHFIDVLQHTRIDDLNFNDELVNADIIVPVQKVLKGLQILELGLVNSITNEFSRSALESFHYYDEFYLERIPFERHEVGRMNKIFMKNLWWGLVSEPGKITIDQLLISNWVEIQLNITDLTEKDFNILLKLWIKGSSPRLTYFYATTFHLLDQKIILKGINCSQIPLDNEEVHIRKIDVHYQETTLAGGSRIKRFDGTTAVVVIDEAEFKIIVDI